MSAGEFDYTVAGPAAWFDPLAFTSNVPGQAAGWFDYDYLEPGISGPTPPPPPKPKPKPVIFPQSTGGGGGGGWQPWSVNDAAIRDRKLRELFEPKVEAPIVKWVEVEEKAEDDEALDEQKPVIFVENVVDTKTIFVPVLIAAPPVVIYETRVPRWIGWTLVAVGATLITVSLIEIVNQPKSKPKRKRRRRRR